MLHQTALGSVPRSLEDPVTSNAANVTGFLNMLVAARDAQVKSFTCGDGSTSRDFRAVDVRHSQADVSKSRRLLGYVPRVTMRKGVALAMPWYLGRLG